jgi:hypothetical protein
MGVFKYFGCCFQFEIYNFNLAYVKIKKVFFCIFLSFGEHRF